MPIPGGEISNRNFTVDLVMLPYQSRTPTKVVVTNAAAASSGAQSMSLSSASAVAIKAGTSLSFIAPSSPTGRFQAMFVNDASLTSVASTAAVSDLLNAIPANATADFYTGLLPLLGIQSFSLQTQDTTEDTTDSRSGIGTEIGKVRSSKTFQVQGIERPGDRALYTIVKNMSLQKAEFGREAFAVLTYPDGEMFRGVAKISNFQQPGTQNTFKKYSFDLMIMGETMEYFTPVIFS